MAAPPAPPAQAPPAVRMARGLHDRLARLARDEAPSEACALLAGTPVEEGNAVSVLAALPATNAADEPETAFVIPSDELIGAYKRAEDNGLAIVGIFHSHPASGAVPSEADRRMMRINPVAWVIYSVRDGEARAHVGGADAGSSEVRLDLE